MNKSVDNSFSQKGAAGVDSMAGRGAQQGASFAAKVGDGVETMIDKASHAVDDARTAAAGAAGSVKSTLSGVAGDATRVLHDAVEEQKNSGAGAIADLARSARDSADGFQHQAPQIAEAVRTVAGKVEQVSNNIKDKSVNEMIESMSGFAHRQPLAFLGCGIVAGLVLSRLLSAPSRS